MSISNPTLNQLYEADHINADMIIDGKFKDKDIEMFLKDHKNDTTEG